MQPRLRHKNEQAIIAGVSGQLDRVQRTQWRVLLQTLQYTI